LWLRKDEQGEENYLFRPNLELYYATTSKEGTLNQPLKLSEIASPAAVKEALELGARCTKSFHFVRFNMYIVGEKIIIFRNDIYTW
tara:strand:- start:960 stop:1217 length:258 start_codon:yes stop_codon:yes gene_type:complete